jgi:hypothetical protein
MKQVPVEKLRKGYVVKRDNEFLAITKRRKAWKSSDGINYIHFFHYTTSKYPDAILSGWMPEGTPFTVLDKDEVALYNLSK